MLNNKSDFILEYNERLNQSLRRDDVDWSASRVIFVSLSFNAYQKNSVTFEISHLSSGKFGSLRDLCGLRHTGLFRVTPDVVVMT